VSAKLPMSIETLQVRHVKKLEARIAQLEGLLETSKGWLENVALNHIGPAHPGPCGPEAGCDMDCAEAASFSAFLEKVNAALKETP